MTPLSPPEGEAAQGAHPLDPLFFLGYISTLSGVISIGRMPEWRGRKHEKVEPPRAIVCFYKDFNKAIFSRIPEKYCWEIDVRKQCRLLH